MVPGALLCVTCWLPYIWLDRQIHPESPLLMWLRLSLSVAAVVSLGLAWWPQPFLRPTSVAVALLGWLQGVGGLIAGLTGGDPVYVGGFILLVMIGPAIPLPRTHAWCALALGYAMLFAAGAGNGLGGATAQARYTLTDVTTAGLVAALLVYVADGLRRETWASTRGLMEQARQQLQAQTQIQTLREMLLAPARDALSPREMQRASLAWHEAWVATCTFDGQIDVASVLPAPALAAELAALDAVLAAVVVARGWRVCVGLDGSRVLVGPSEPPRDVEPPTGTGTLDRGPGAPNVARLGADRAQASPAPGGFAGPSKVPGDHVANATSAEFDSTGARDTGASPDIVEPAAQAPAAPHIAAAGLGMQAMVSPSTVADTFEALRAAAAEHDASLAKRGLPPWRLRLGASHGPVLTAATAERTLALDLWSDTVARALAAGRAATSVGSTDDHTEADREQAADGTGSHLGPAAFDADTTSERPLRAGHWQPKGHQRE